jgi:hypothetical protein
VNLRASHAGGDDRFEGDRTLTLHALPVDVQVTRATITVAPSGQSFTEVVDFVSGDPIGATQVTGNQSAEVDFHARRTLAAVSGTNLTNAALLLDAGGLFIEVGESGAIRTPPAPALTLAGNTSDLPGLTVARFRLRLPNALPQGDVASVSTVTIRSVASNLTVRLGEQPPFWTRLGDLTVPATSPDFSAALLAYLLDAAVSNGSYIVPLTVHSDTLARLDATLEVEFLRRRRILPDGLDLVTLPYDFGGIPQGDAALTVDLPAGAQVPPGATAGRVAGSFEATRIVFGPVGRVPAPAAAAVTPSRVQAQPLVLPHDETFTSLDLLVAAVTPSATVSVTLAPDTDGKPLLEPLLPQPLTARLSRSAGGGAAWVNLPLPAELLLLRGSYWVVVQALEGEAVCRAGPAAVGDPGMHSSADGGLSWRATTAAELPGALATPVRLRRIPATFQMPIELRIGGVGGAGAGGAGAVQRVPLDRFAPLGRVDFALDFPAVADAVNRQLAQASPPTCGEAEHLANGQFAFERWRPTGTADEELPEEWELTSGHAKRMRPHGAELGRLPDPGTPPAPGPNGPTGLSQLVPVLGGCRYRFAVVATATRDDAVAEVTWLSGGCDGLRVDRLPIAQEAPEGDLDNPVARIDLAAPAGATQAEVRLVVPEPTVARVQQMSLATTADTIINGDLRELTGIAPAGWTPEPTGSLDDLFYEVVDEVATLRNDGAADIALVQRVTAAPQESWTLDFSGLARAGVDGRSPRIELDWLGTAGEQTAADVVESITATDFDRLLAEGTVPAGTNAIALRLVLPPGGVVRPRVLALRFPLLTTIPVTFVAQAPGELTLAGAEVAFDQVEPAPPEVPATGLCAATPPGREPGARPPDCAFCPCCGKERTLGDPAAAITRAGRPGRVGTCPGCGTELVRLGGRLDTAARRVPSGVGGAVVVEIAPQLPKSFPLTTVRGISVARSRLLADTGIDSLKALAAAAPEAVAGALRGVSTDAAGELIAQANRIIDAGVRIAFVQTVGRGDRRRVLAVGGVNPDASGWSLAEATAVEDLRTRQWSFSVRDAAGIDVPVGVVRTAGAQHHLTTAPRGSDGNALLDLPPFPAGLLTR